LLTALSEKQGPKGCVSTGSPVSPQITSAAGKFCAVREDMSSRAERAGKAPLARIPSPQEPPGAPGRAWGCASGGSPAQAQGRWSSLPCLPGVENYMVKLPAEFQDHSSLLA